LLDDVLGRRAKYGLKMHAKKCQFFTREIVWCGKVISESGVRHSSELVQGLVDMQTPRTGGELQQFLCAANWMRQSIPEFTRLTAPLYAALDRAATAAGSRKKTKLERIQLAETD